MPVHNPKLWIWDDHQSKSCQIMQLGGGFEIGRWWHGCALLTMSPLPTVISWRNTICLVSTIHSDISLFLLEEDFEGWTAGAAAEKSKQTSGFDFLWVTGDLGAGRIHSGQEGYQWFRDGRLRWNNLHSYLNITLVKLWQEMSNLRELFRTEMTRMDEME